MCKMMTGERRLRKATKFAMSKLAIQEHESLDGEKLIEAQEIWISTHEDHVRMTINNQRNYTQGEVRDHYKQHVFPQRE